MATTTHRRGGSNITEQTRHMAPARVQKERQEIQPCFSQNGVDVFFRREYLTKKTVLLFKVKEKYPFLFDQQEVNKHDINI